MLRYLLLGTLALLVYSISQRIISFRKNLRNAKNSGIPYIIIPVYHLERWWLITHRAFFPLFRRLPKRWTTWVDYALPQWSFDYSIIGFDRVGSETFYAVAPGTLTLYTCDPAVIHQIISRRNDFPKPIQIYQLLDIYGKNVVSTEGHLWRQHRKAVSPPFTEKNNHLVWTETIKQARSMLGSWIGVDGKGDKTVDRMMDDTMRLSLSVISFAGFGRTIEWPSENSEHKSDDASYIDPSKIKNQADDIDPGHAMSYTYAIHCLLDNILVQFLLPRWVLQYFPNATLKKANQAYDEWGKYMRELLSKKRADIESGAASTDTNDILTQLVKDQLVNKEGKTKPLKEDEILGNMFTLILAGHETAANSIHFAILYLALYPESQANLHKDLDQIFEGRTPDRWTYEEDLPQLFGGMAGAVLAEELRLCPPIVGIPKSSFGSSENVLMVEGKECIVPAETYIPLASICAHKNPRYWPHGPSRLPGGHPVHPLSNVDNDLEEFRPERWLQADHKPTDDGIPVETLASGADDGLNVNQSSDTSDKLLKPTKGAYTPFSDGFRACIGRRFAQVEVLATLAVIFQNYSVELAVDRYASDEQLKRMDDNAKADVWQKAAEDARSLMLNNMEVIITLQIRGGTVPFRFVPRDRERFPTNVDEIWKKNHPDKINPKGDPEWSFWRKPKPSMAKVKMSQLEVEGK